MPCSQRIDGWRKNWSGGTEQKLLLFLERCWGKSVQASLCWICLHSRKRSKGLVDHSNRISFLMLFDLSTNRSICVNEIRRPHWTICFPMMLILDVDFSSIWDPIRKNLHEKNERKKKKRRLNQPQKHDTLFRRDLRVGVVLDDLLKIMTRWWF